jgi:hypothetical protein
MPRPCVVDVPLLKLFHASFPQKAKGPLWQSAFLAQDSMSCDVYFKMLLLRQREALQRFEHGLRLLITIGCHGCATAPSFCADQP